MRFTKGKYRFSAKEVWNLKDALGDIIADGLEQFKLSGLHGCPFTLLKPDQDNPEGTIDSDTAYMEWLSIIDKMIYAFRNHELDYYSAHPDVSYMSELKFKETSAIVDGITHSEIVFVPKTGYTIEQVEEQRRVSQEWNEAHEIKVKEGIDLFSQYFQNLWD